MLTVTVSQLSRYLKSVIEEDRKLADIYVKGEISGYARHYRSGHLYFTLRDKEAVVKAVMFRSAAQSLKFEPEDGMAVLVRCGVGVYERDGVYQLYVREIQPDGVGALAVAFEQVKARLSALGMFDEAHKKPLPPWPKRIGVVTSEGGAAYQDIRNILGRRYPLATLVLAAAPVQGREAPEALARAIKRLDERGRCDVIILGRGGGSAEDLAAFNDEGLARAVFAAKTPVVSAVGHETDYTVCDLVADLRAPTPSAAAELSTPSAAELSARLGATRSRMEAGAASLLSRSGERILRYRNHRALRSPRNILFSKQERLDFLSNSLYNRKRIQLRRFGDALQGRAALLDSLSPLRVLGRGYCVALAEKRAVLSVSELRPGQKLGLRFQDGGAEAIVWEITKESARDQRGG